MQKNELGHGVDNDRSRERRPALLRDVLELDEQLTRKLSVFASAHDPKVSRVRSWLKLLEVSCHGVPCIGSTLLLLWMSEDKLYQQHWLNTYLALLLDIICVAIIKASVRRRRPSNNHADMFATFAVDKLSFPSGHATRAVLLSCILIYKSEMHVVVQLLAFLWALAVSVSRVLLGRHHVLDVVGGVVVGLAEYVTISVLWLDADSARALIAFFNYFQAFHLADE